MSNAVHVWLGRTAQYHCLMCAGRSDVSPFRPEDHAPWCHRIRWFLYLDMAGFCYCGGWSHG